MTIREQPAVRSTRLPDGRTVDVRVVVADDSYLERSEEELVVVELVENGEVLGVVATPLLVDDVERARQLAEAVREGLGDGSLEPSAEGIEGMALSPPS